MRSANISLKDEITSPYMEVMITFIDSNSVHYIIG